MSFADMRACVEERGGLLMPQECSALLDIAEGSVSVLALAFVSGRWEDGPANAIPQDVWDHLYASGLITSAGDQSGESWPVITGAGENALVEFIREAANSQAKPS